MQMPSFIDETLAQAKRQPVWGVAFFATLLMPVMLIYSRVGMEITTGIIGFCFLLQSFRARQWRWVRAPFTLACFAAWAWMLLVVTPLAVSPKGGVVEAALWFRLPLLFAALRYWVLDDADARATLGLIFGGILALVAVDCLVQAFTGMSLSGHAMMPYNRLSGPFKNPKVGIYLGLTAVPSVAYCFAAGMRMPCKRLVMASLALAFLLVAAIVLSGERSAFIGVVMASGVATALLAMGDKRVRVAGCIVAVGAVGLIALLYLSLPTVQARAAEMMDVLADYPGSPYGMLAGTGVAMGEEHWVHGIGIQGFKSLSPTLNYQGTQFHGLHPHNYYSEWFAEAGLPGLLLFIMMIGCLTWEAVKRLRGIRGVERLAAATALGVLLQHFFPLMPSQSFFTNWGAVLQWFSLSLAFAALPRNDLQA